MAARKMRILLCLCALWVSVLSACADGKKLPTVGVVFATEDGQSSPLFTVEVCSNPRERALGLMYRKSLPANAGMLFVFPSERDNAFWMKNTYLSLDMVFVDAKLKVVGLLENVPPLNEEPRGVGVSSQYVVEFPAGTAHRYGLKTGSQMRIEGALPTVR